MQTTVNLPDPLYQKSDALADSRGATVEQFIVEAVKKEVQVNLGSGTSGTYGDRKVELPVIRSTRPGTLDLSNFDFDDLLPDVNVWIALAAERHVFHRTAKQWFGNSSRLKARLLPPYPDGLPASVDEQVRHARRVMKPDEAWETYSVLRLERRIGYLAEPSELPETWQAFTAGPLSSPNLWTDPYLCAFAHAARLTLVTFDAKIPTREGVNCVVVSP